MTAARGDFAAVARAALGLVAAFLTDLLHRNPPFGLWRRRAAPPKPRLGQQAGGAGFLGAHDARI